MVSTIDGLLKKLSIRKRIYLSFSILVLLFVANCIVTVWTINRNNSLYEHIGNVINPTLEQLDDFREMILESKMYSTNWVFLRSNAKDRAELLVLHEKRYPALKKQFASLTTQWPHHNWVDSLNTAFGKFEIVLAAEQQIIGSLKEPRDYNDPFIRLEAERIIEDKVIPQTQQLLGSIERIFEHLKQDEALETARLENYSLVLRSLVLILAILIIFLGIFLSLYMTKVIIRPIKKIMAMVNDLGKGIIRKVELNQNNDEIGRMALAVNRLSENLMATATFAEAIGKRNFNIPYHPLSDEDTLGKALISMRDNIRIGDEKLNEAQHIAHLGNWERDIQSDNISMSDEMFNILELDPATFDGRFHTIMNLIHPDDLEWFKMIGRTQLLEGEPVEYECRIITASGTTKVLYVQSELVPETADGVKRTFGVVQDITNRKKAELDLIEREKQLRELSDRLLLATRAANLGIWDFNVVTNQMVWDDAMYTLYGVSKEQYANVYDAWKAALHPDEVMRGLAEIRKAIKGRRELNTEFKIVRPDGKVRHIHATALVERDSLGAALRVIGTNRDITEQKNASLEREKIIGEVIHRNKSLEQFTYIVSHNLRAPVANILGLSTILNDKDLKLNTASRSDLLNGITQSVERLDEVVLDLNSILEVKQQVLEKMERIDLNSLTEYTQLTFNKFFTDGIAELHTDFSRCPKLVTLKSYLFSVFYNLVSNSIKYRKENRKLEIGISSYCEDEFIVLKFTDNGKGIDLKRDSDNIFGLYKRFDTSVEGRGVGLFMVKSQIQSLGGDITVESTVDAGSSFSVRLPHNLDTALLST